MTTLNNQPATKGDIDNLYKKIKGEFATKDDLKRFATKDDLDDFREEFNGKITEFKSEILDSVDGVMGELKAIRENQEAHDFSHSRINDDLSDHEGRIKKLEKVSLTI